MIAFAKNSDIQKWFEAKNMSNSTQNKCPFCKSELISLVLPSNPPQYKTYCPNCEKYKVSNSTQKNEIKQIEKAIDEGFAESERDLKDKKTPLDQPTQNDWEVRFNDRFLNNWGTLLDIKHFIRKELADARREVIEKVEALLCTHNYSSMNLKDVFNIKEEIRYILATLKEEEK